MKIKQIEHLHDIDADMEQTNDVDVSIYLEIHLFIVFCSVNIVNLHKFSLFFFYWFKLQSNLFDDDYPLDRVNDVVVNQDVQKLHEVKDRDLRI